MLARIQWTFLEEGEEIFWAFISKPDFSLFHVKGFKNKFNFKDGKTINEAEIKQEDIQITYFKWLFSENPTFSPMDAILKFTQNYKGTPLLVGQQLSCIKSKPNL